MHKAYAFSEEQIQELRKERSSQKDCRVKLRLDALCMRSEGKGYAEIAAYLHVNAKVVMRWVGRYMRNGIKDIVILRYGGNNRNISYKEEEEFVSQYETEAEKGHVIVITEMKKAYDELIGHESGNETIYRLLKRHEWRKIMPRSKHPKKASEAEIKTAKNKIKIGGEEAQEFQ